MHKFIFVKQGNPLHKIIEASLSELFELRIQHQDHLIYSTYISVLIAYLQHDIPELQRILKNIDPELKTIQLLTQLRLGIRNRDVSKELLNSLIQHTTLESIWEGEIHFVIALAYEIKGDYFNSKNHFLKSAQTLENQGCLKKSVKALQNYVASESRIHPDKKLIADYLFVAQKAKTAGDTGIAGIAIMNISREYQKLGAFELALKYCDEALILLNPDIASIHYYLAVVHRCHLLIDLQRNQEALLEFQKASIADFPEIKSALEVLKNKLNPCAEKKSSLENLTPTWKERLFESPMTNIERLSLLEQRLLEFLSEQPREKFELLKLLYGEKLNIDVLENRFKVLLSRLRKKRPELILYENGKYRISDEVFLNDISSNWRSG